jgi:protein pelota
LSNHPSQAVLSDPSVASRLADTAAAGDAGALDRFFALLATDPDRAYYGYKRVAWYTFTFHRC